MTFGAAISFRSPSAHPSLGLVTGRIIILALEPTSFSHEAFKLTKYRGYCLGDRAFCLIDIDKLIMSEVDELNLYYETIRSDWYVASSH